MSFHIHFDLSTGIKQTIYMPPGTVGAMWASIHELQTKLAVEEADGGAWNTAELLSRDGIRDSLLCEQASQYNQAVRWFYKRVEEATTEPKGKSTEPFTPERAEAIWPKLREINVPTERWSGEYYTEQMEEVYQVLRTGKAGRMSFDEFKRKPLTPRQAADVIIIFSQWLDHEDRRLDVPNNHDHLKSSYDGGYHWCEICGPVDEDDEGYLRKRCKRKGCPLRKEQREEDEADKRYAERRRAESVLRVLQDTSEPMSAYQISRRIFAGSIALDNTMAIAKLLKGLARTGQVASVKQGRKLMWSLPAENKASTH